MIARIVAEAFPQLFYSFPRTYRVASVRSDKRLDLVPPDDAPHLPELNAVPQWGVGQVTPAVGSEVTVVFRDADPSRPIVVHWEFDAPPTEVHLQATSGLKLDGDSTVTIDSPDIKLGASAGAGVARQEDTVTVLLPPATFTGTVGGSPASGMILWTPAQTTGTITTSSAVVKSE